MTKYYTFYLYFSQSAVYIIKMCEIIFWGVSAVPQRLRNTDLGDSILPQSLI
jgi:hypothetical protein